MLSWKITVTYFERQQAMIAWQNIYIDLPYIQNMQDLQHRKQYTAWRICDL